MEDVTIGQLITQLQKYPKDMPVVMAQDEEGNGYTSTIDVANDNDQCVILWPGRFDEIDEVVDGYEYIG